MQFKSIFAAFLGGLAVLCLASSFAFAQVPTEWNNCPEIGIKTNPLAPVNPQDPSKLNTFNWQDKLFSVNGASLTQIHSPFFQPDNDLVEPLRRTQDQKNSEGWEFIKKGFGSVTGGTDISIALYPYYILYNKHTAIMRVFFAGATNIDSETEYNAAEISLEFTKGAYQSSALMLANEPAAIFDKFIHGQKMVSATEFSNYTARWVYADFPMTYDPCACNYRSRLVARLKLIKNSKINMVGVSTGSLTNIEEGTGSVNQTASKWTLQNVIGAGKKANETYNSINGYTSKQLAELNKSNAQTTPTVKGATSVNSATATDKTAYIKN